MVKVPWSFGNNAGARPWDIVRATSTSAAKNLQQIPSAQLKKQQKQEKSNEKINQNELNKWVKTRKHVSAHIKCIQRDVK